MRPPDEPEQPSNVFEAEEVSAFPPGFDEVETLVREAEERLQHLDEQIANVLPDRPAPALRPPGFMGDRQPGNQQRQIAGLESQKAQVRTDAMHQVEQGAGHADKSTKELVMETANRRLADKAKNADAAREQQDITGKGRDLNASQEWAMKKLDQERSAPVRETAAEPVTEKGAEEKSGSFSLRFSQSLSYTKHTQEAAEKTSEKSPKVERAQPEPERE